MARDGDLALPSAGAAPRGSRGTRSARPRSSTPRDGASSRGGGAARFAARRASFQAPARSRGRPPLPHGRAARRARRTSAATATRSPNPRARAAAGGRALDLCTGIGVHAILARARRARASESTGNPRALSFARWNVGANGVAERCELPARRPLDALAKETRRPLSTSSRPAVRPSRHEGRRRRLASRPPADLEDVLRACAGLPAPARAATGSRRSSRFRRRAAPLLPREASKVARPARGALGAARAPRAESPPDVRGVADAARVRRRTRAVRGPLFAAGSTAPPPRDRAVSGGVLALGRHPGPRRRLPRASTRRRRAAPTRAR